MAVVFDVREPVSPQADDATGPGSTGTVSPGMTIYTDSGAGSTGPQLLYQAIGGGNLRTYGTPTPWATRR
jgi:hypothetical protein